MPLNLDPQVGGDYAYWIKYNAVSSRWFVKTDSGEVIEVPLTAVVAVFDFPQIKTGWIVYAEGQPPKTLWDVGGIIPPRPDDMPRAKRGFAVNIFSPKLGGLREFSATSNAVVVPIRDLYNDHFEPAPERLRGLLPVVRCIGATPEKTKFGISYVLTLKLTKWVERPIGLPLDEPPKTAAEMSKTGLGLGTTAAALRSTLLGTTPAKGKTETGDDFDVDFDLDDEIPI